MNGEAAADRMGEVGSRADDHARGGPGRLFDGGGNGTHTLPRTAGRDAQARYRLAAWRAIAGWDTVSGPLAAAVAVVLTTWVLVLLGWNFPKEVLQWLISLTN